MFSLECVSERTREGPRSARIMILRNIVILLVEKTGNICDGEKTVLQDCDSVRISIVMKKKQQNLMQSVFPDSALRPRKCSQFFAVLVQDESYSFWFAQTILIFQAYLPEQDSEKKWIYFFNNLMLPRQLIWSTTICTVFCFALGNEQQSRSLW